MAVPTFTSSDLVLVTGANGHVGQHVVDQLLRLSSPPRIRGTVRSKSKADEIYAFYKSKGEISIEPLELIVVEDITKESSFTEALKGVTHVAHIASPIIVSQEDIEKNVLDPAIKGTSAVLKAAAKAGTVKRVVVTSSFGAVADISKGWRPGYTYSEKDFNPLERENALDPKYGESAALKDAEDVHKGYVGYLTSKILAERAAWNLAPRSPLPAEWIDSAISKEERASYPDLSVVLPVYIFGPHVLPLGERSPAGFSFSNQLLWKTATGETGTEGGAHVPLDWPQGCDVRDVAKAHILALTNDKAQGERFIVSTRSFSWSEIADIAKKHSSTFKGSNGPPQDIPHWEVNSSKSLEVLGLGSYIPFEKSIIDTLETVG